MVGIDQSIDTLKLDEFDYVEDINITPRDGKKADGKSDAGFMD